MGRRKKGRDVHGIILLDKAQGITSNRALQEVRHLFGARKAGHTGTLDPLATGMLPVCLGEATKVSHFLLDADKVYLAGARFGSLTDTGDRDGTVIETNPLPDDFSSLIVENAAASFVGSIDQIPPMYSALKHDGQRLYELARKGQEVERAPRRVTISSIDLLEFDGDLAILRVRCSKGTYIRTLVEDIGKLIGCGAHIDSLRRESVAPFDNLELISADELRSLVDAESGGFSALDRKILPIDSAINHLPEYRLALTDLLRFSRGQEIVPRAPLQGDVDQLFRIYDPEQRFLGLGSLDGSLTEGQKLLPKRVLNL